MTQKIVFLQYEVTPEKGTELAEAYGGALISAWIRAQSVKSAKAIFAKELQGTGWKVYQFEDGYVVEKNHYSPEDEEFPLYQQVLADDNVFYIDAWPADDT